MKRFIILVAAIVCGSLTVSLAASPADKESPNNYGENMWGLERDESGIRHQVEVNAGFITGGKLRLRDDKGLIKTNFSRPYIDAVVGARFTDYVFAGVGVGVQYAYGDCRLIQLATQNAPEKWGAVMMPIYFNVKGYVPTKTIVYPYISVGIGGNVVLSSNFSREGYGHLRGGMFCKFGAGLTVSKFNLGLGMVSQSLKWINADNVTNFKAGNNAFYIEAGVKF